MKLWDLILHLYSKRVTNHKFPKINVTWSGAIYLDPEDVLNSENAQKQIRELKNTALVKNLKEKRNASRELEATTS